MALRTPAHGGGSPELAKYGAPGLSFLWSFILRHYGDEAISFHLPLAVEAAFNELVMAARLDRSSTAVGAASSGALAPWSAPAVVVQARAPPPTVDSTWEALI
jgi:hypothetical protein